MKILAKAFLLSLAASLAVAANSGKVDLKELQKQVAALQAQVDELKASSNNAKLQEQIDELYDRADQNEFAATLNKVKMGLEMTTGVTSANIKYRAATPDLATGSLISGKDAPMKKHSSDGRWATEVHLNLNAQINDRTKFTGRLAMAKYWGSYGASFGINDFEAGKNLRGGSSIYLDRAYLDYEIIPGMLIATVGRQPGTDGPGSNLRNNSARMSTYPALLVNAMGDAAVLTYKPERLKDYNVALRVAYITFYQNIGFSDVSRHLAERGIGDNSRLYFAMAEGELPLGDFGKNVLMLSYIHGNKFMVPMKRSLLGTMILDRDYNVGNADAINLHFESTNTFGSPFSWFASLGFWKGSNARDNSAEMRAEMDPVLRAAGAVVPELANPAVRENIENMVIENTKWNEKTGWAIHLGARYDFTSAFKLGVEFLHGSKYWYAIGRSSINDPFDFRNTRGNVYDIYAIWQLDLNQYLRFSYTHIDYKYTNSSKPVGGAVRTDDKANVFSLIYNVRF